MLKTQPNSTAKMARNCNLDALKPQRNDETQRGDTLTTPQRQYLERLPPHLRTLFKKAYSGRSPAAAIRARCLDCCACQPREVLLCPARNCPLWGYRLSLYLRKKTFKLDETETEGAIIDEPEQATSDR